MEKMINNIEDLINIYYKNILFLSVPNICNSKCYYCYLKPDFFQKAVLSNTILDRINKIVYIAKDIGFNEFRITGGEPLIYENVSELLSIFNEKSISYTLLTNGMNIKNNIELFKENRPKKITISYHSKKYHNSIFGVKFDTNILDDNIRELCKMNINITISIIMLERNKYDIIPHVYYLRSLGVKSIKLIYPNYKEIKMSLSDKFIEIINEINSITGIDVRYSELNLNICSMINRGFLSFSLSKNILYGCCNTITNKIFVNSIISYDNITKILWEFYNAAQAIIDFPCENYVRFCPIVLNK